MPTIDVRHRSVDEIVAELLSRVGRLEQARRLSYTATGAARFVNGIDTEGTGDVSDPDSTSVTPDPVQDVTLTPGTAGDERYIDVAWTLPADLAGVHGIVVRAAKVIDPGGAGETVQTADAWETGTFGPVRIRALEAGTTYDVTVLTVNARGTTGDPVTARDATAAAAPDLTARQLTGPWAQDNVPAGQATTDATLLGGVRTRLPMVRNGSVTGLAVELSEPLTAGTLTVEVTIDGAATGLTVILDGSLGHQRGQIVQAIGGDTFAAGARIGATVASSADLAPATADVTATVEIHA